MGLKILEVIPGEMEVGLIYLERIILDHRCQQQIAFNPTLFESNFLIETI